MLNIYALTSGIEALLILVPLAMMVYILLRDMSEAILCMECQQCRAVCPVLQVTPEYIGPKDIMVAAKSVKYDKAISEKLYLCTSCAACMERCPRNLEVDEMVRKICGVELSNVVKRDTIAYTQQIPNQKMQRTYEMIIRRLEGKKLKIPWEWIKKFYRTRKFYNPIEDKATKPKIQEHIADGLSGLKKLQLKIFENG